MTGERTLVIIKPDGVQRRLVGKILDRFLMRGLRLVGLKMTQLDEDIIQQNYAAHCRKSFYKALVDFMSSGPVVLVIFEGKDAVQVVRSMLGSTDAAQATPGTIRGDFGLSTRHNLIHASDSISTAKKEIELLFEESDIMEFAQSDEKWVFGRVGDTVI